MLYTNFPSQSNRLFLPSATPSESRTGESRKLGRNSLVGNSVSSGQLPFAEVLFFLLARADNTTDQPDGETDLGRNQDAAYNALITIRFSFSAIGRISFPSLIYIALNAHSIYIRDINLSEFKYRFAWYYDNLRRTLYRSMSATLKAIKVL